MAPARHHPQGFGRLTAQSWEIGMARMPAFVPDQDGTPMRPLLVMVMDGTGRIRVTQTCHPDQAEEALPRALQEAIERPASGCLPGLPEQVVVPNARLLELLPALLPGVNIRLGPTPLLDQAMDSLREHFRVESPPGECLALSTYLTQDVTPEIYSHFGVSNQTGQAHSKKVRDLLKIGMFDAKWALPSQLDNSPMAWMLEVDGFILDIRTMPLEIQIEACAKGLIPYVLALRDRGQQTS